MPFGLASSLACGSVEAKYRKKGRSLLRSMKAERMFKNQVGTVLDLRRRDTACRTAPFPGTTFLSGTRDSFEIRKAGK